MIEDTTPFKKIFRKDINGLRAIAVLLVLIYHVDNRWLNAGFLGVDIFLVISGYLISKSILFDLHKGSFSFANFYTRRVRRLFPALAFTLLLSLLFSAFLFSSFFFEQIANSVLAAVFSISNIFFWTESGYFDLGAELKPLLHTWSLGLEEQYYLFWPLLLVGLSILNKKLFWPALLIIAILSTGLAEYWNTNYPSGTFYLLPFRIFEFVLGALCLKLEKQFPDSRSFNIPNFLFGLMLIIGPAIFLNKYTSMPGLWSLLPCLGAMLILCGKPNRLTTALLENPVISIIGLASYSIYLFHWPLIVFYKHWKLSEIGNAEKAVLFFVSLAGGILMWKLIERLLKNPSISNKAVWKTFLFVSLFLSILSGVVMIKDGFPSKDKNPYTMTPEEIIEERNRYWLESGAKKFPSIDSTTRNVVVLGNSHGIDLVYALVNNNIKSNIVFIPTTDRCSNFGRTPNVNIKKEQNFCYEVNSDNLRRPEWSRADAIYLHDDWVAYNAEELLDQINEIRKLTNAPIYLFGPKMSFTQFPLSIIKASNSVVPTEINQYARQFVNVRASNINKALKAWFRNQTALSDVDYINVIALQEPYELVSTKTSKLLYHDGGHLNENGATEIGEKLKRRHPSLFK